MEISGLFHLGTDMSLGKPPSAGNGETAPASLEDKSRALEDKSRADSRNFDRYECETCRNRKYQDGSSDPGVSFKTPTNRRPEQSSSAVRSHEYEHVSREQSKAAREDREVVSQSVTYSTGICPECGRAYVSPPET